MGNDGYVPEASNINKFDENKYNVTDDTGKTWGLQWPTNVPKESAGVAAEIRRREEEQEKRAKQPYGDKKREQFEEYDDEPARDLEKKEEKEHKRLNVQYVKKKSRVDIDMLPKYHPASEEDANRPKPEFKPN